MKNNYFVNENQLEQWIEAAEGIEERFGIDKALGYIIGEKFYNLVKDLRLSKEMMKEIKADIGSPNCNDIQNINGAVNRNIIERDTRYNNYKHKCSILPIILLEFTTLIKSSFSPHEIIRYFDSNPRLGSLGHVTTEEEHKVFVENGAVEHSTETEIEDALIIGEMKE